MGTRRKTVIDAPQMRNLVFRILRDERRLFDGLPTNSHGRNRGSLRRSMISEFIHELYPGTAPLPLLCRTLQQLRQGGYIHWIGQRDGWMATLPLRELPVE